MSCTQVFGLHANADISYMTETARRLWSGLIDLQPRVGAGGGASSSGMSREAHVAHVAADITARLPKQFDLPLLTKSLASPSPTQVVLLQELARWNDVLSVIGSSLCELQRGLSGVSALSAHCTQSNGRTHKTVH